MITRRKTLQLLAAAAALPAAAAPVERRTGMGLVLYCCKHKRTQLKKRTGEDLFQPLTFLRHCRSLGAGGAQMNLKVMDARDAKALRKEAETCDMYIEAIIGPPKKESDLDRFRAEMKTAVEVGARAVRTVIIPGRRYEYFKSLEMFRTSWTDPNAVCLAIKGGSPGVSHGHMDVGSFVIDASGLRWAADLGPESYHKIESRGMSLWGRSQDAQRWTIFRYHNLSHNTLAVNGQHQRVRGSAPIIRYSDRKTFPHVVFDMSSVYEGQLAQALRGASLLPSGHILIQDEFLATDQAATVRWAMVTPASVSIEDDKNALLNQEGKTLRLSVLTDAKVQLRTYSTAPQAEYDAPNPGTRMIAFKVALSAGQTARTAVLLTPPAAQAKTSVELQPLLQWSPPQ